MRIWSSRWRDREGTRAAVAMPLVVTREAAQRSMPLVSSPPSRYGPDGAADYSHRFHAGNVGDVWKHCVLLEILRHAGDGTARTVYVESHAGEGGYALGP